MTREEHTAHIQNILGMIAPEHQADASAILNTLSEDYDSTLTTSETLTTNNATLQANNERLRQVNTDLFLKVGTPVKNKPETNEDLPTIKVTDLFNEKGDLI